MLKIVIPSKEYYDETTSEFFNIKSYSLTLEHSLVSLSKWEAKWHKPFLTKSGKTVIETIDYIRYMTLTQNIPVRVYEGVTRELLNCVTDYIEAPMTATTFSDRHNKVTNNRIITSEVIYSWMVVLNIPFECQKWHLNRLLTLINVCNIQNQPPKKMTKAEMHKRNRELNAARRAKYNTKG